MVTIAAHDPPIYKLERHRRAPGQFQSSPERVQDATGFYIYRQMSAEFLGLVIKSCFCQLVLRTRKSANNI